MAKKLRTRFCTHGIVVYGFGVVRVVDTDCPFVEEIVFIYGIYIHILNYRNENTVTTAARKCAIVVLFAVFLLIISDTQVFTLK